MSDNNKPIKH